MTGEVYRMERVQRANVVSLSAFNHPNVVTGEDRIPGAVTRDVTVRRINEWCRRLQPGERRGSECFRLPDFLNGSIADSQSGIPYPPLKPGDYRIMEPTFSYMVLGKYPAQAATALISKEWIARARSRGCLCSRTRRGSSPWSTGGHRGGCRRIWHRCQRCLLSVWWVRRADRHMVRIGSYRYR
jgi:hypothetical protein